MNDYLKWLEIINKLLTIVGDVPLSEAKTWVEVKANAEDLKKEGHDEENEVVKGDDNEPDH